MICVIVLIPVEVCILVHIKDVYWNVYIQTGKFKFLFTSNLLIYQHLSYNAYALHNILDYSFRFMISYDRTLQYFMRIIFYFYSLLDFYCDLKCKATPNQQKSEDDMFMDISYTSNHYLGYDHIKISIYVHWEIF